MAFSSSGAGPFSDDMGQGTGGPRFAVLAQVRAYWQGLRHGMALPQRDMIDPRGIAEALESTFLLERVAPGIARFRIAGMHLHDLIGLDVRGMPLSTLFDPAARTRLAEGLEAVFTTPAILEMWLEAERSLGRPRLEGRMLVLPLSDAQGHSTLALGCLALAGALCRAPRRFAMMGLMREPLKVEQTGDPAQTIAKDKDSFTPLPALGKVTGISADGAKKPMFKPKLRLVYSRD